MACQSFVQSGLYFESLIAASAPEEKFYHARLLHRKKHVSRALVRVSDREKKGGPKPAFAIAFAPLA